MNLGPAYLELDAIGGRQRRPRSYGHQIQVQEFRRPEFEVKLNPGRRPVLRRRERDVEVSATYYAGGPLPNARSTGR